MSEVEASSPTVTSPGVGSPASGTDSPTPKSSKSKIIAPPKCASCSKGVYPLEKVEACDKVYHKQCFKCKHCGGVLGLKGFATINNDPYCKPHYMELFKSKGNYAVFSGEDAKGGTTYTGSQGFAGVDKMQRDIAAGKKPGSPSATTRSPRPVTHSPKVENGSGNEDAKVAVDETNGSAKVEESSPAQKLEEPTVESNGTHEPQKSVETSSPVEEASKQAESAKAPERTGFSKPLPPSALKGQVKVDQDEIKKQEEEEKKKAEQDEKKKAADEAKRKSVEEARKKSAEEETKRKAAEEESRKKAAEEESKRKTEEETKRKAEQDKKSSEPQQQQQEDSSSSANDEEKRKMEAEMKKFQEEKKQFEEDRKRMEAEKQKMEQEKKKFEEEKKKHSADQAQSKSSSSESKPESKSEPKPASVLSPPSAVLSPLQKALLNSPAASRAAAPSSSPTPVSQVSSGSPNIISSPTPGSPSTPTTPGGSKSKIVAPPKCASCSKGVYPLEKIEACDKVYHKQCFKCKHCGGVLGLKGFATINNDPYCKPHYMELFKSKGNYAVFSGEDAKGGTTYTGSQGFAGVDKMQRDIRAKDEAKAAAKKDSPQVEHD